MTTRAWTSNGYVSDSVAFRQIGSELSAKLAEVGLVQTADTGQINWSTVTTPGVNTEAGYEMWRFNDALQATAPVYIRIGYGCTTSGVTMRLVVQIGTGTNGAGTLTGTTSTSTNCTYNNAGITTGNFPSYLSAGAGYVCLAWKINTSGGDAFFGICRTCDATGAGTAHGAFMITRYLTNIDYMQMTCLRFATTAAKTVDNVRNYCSLLPGNLTSSLVNGEFSAYVIWGSFKEVKPCFAMAATIPAELPFGSTMLVAVVGTTERTYLGLGTSRIGAIQDGLALAMLWE